MTHYTVSAITAGGIILTMKREFYIEADARNEAARLYRELGEAVENVQVMAHTREHVKTFGVSSLP